MATASENRYDNISSEAVEKATGRSWDKWFELLDSAGASEMKHSEIAAWLNENHIESGWWSQSVTVGYERARGMRQRHEKSDGFSVSVSKTIGKPVSELYADWTEGGRRANWLPDVADIDFTTANLNKNLRARWPNDGSQLIVYFYDRGDDRCQVVVQCEQLGSGDDVEPRKGFWKDALARLATVEGQ